MAIAGVVLALLFIVTVVIPAVRIGGVSEFAMVAGIFAFILVVERFIRTR